jgi:hypothetical protein
MGIRIALTTILLSFGVASASAVEVTIGFGEETIFPEPHQVTSDFWGKPDIPFFDELFPLTQEFLTRRSELLRCDWKPKGFDGMLLAR